MPQQQAHQQQQQQQAGQSQQQAQATQQQAGQAQPATQLAATSGLLVPVLMPLETLQQLLSLVQQRQAFAVPSTTPALPGAGSTLHVALPAAPAPPAVAAATGQQPDLESMTDLQRAQLLASLSDHAAQQQYKPGGGNLAVRLRGGATARRALHITLQ
jgi:hypothetical protein